MRFSINGKLKFRGPYIRLLLSLLRKSYSSHIFIFIPLLPEGRAGEAWEPCNKVMFFLLQISVTTRTARFNIHKFHVLPTQCIYVFCVDLRTNSDYFPIEH
jgi:hypothetical protein